MQRRDDPPELSPLFDAIAAAPDDDGPRQVLADALQERGDPRGEFIALQLLEARGLATPEQVSRAQALAGRHCKAWLSEIPGLGTVPTARRPRTEFHRGFLRRAGLVTPRGRGVDSPTWRMLETLEVIGPGDDAKELTSPWLERLTELLALDLAALEHVVEGPPRPHLRRLSCDGFALRSPREQRLLEALAMFPALRHLRLAFTQTRHHAGWFGELLAAPGQRRLETLELMMEPPWDVAGLHALLVSTGLERLTLLVCDQTLGLRFDRQHLVIELADERALTRRAQMLRNLVPRFSPFPFPTLSVRVGNRLATVEELSVLGPVVEARVR